MSAALVPVEPGLLAEPNTLLATITRLAMAPEIRVDLLTLLLDRQERAEAKDAERQYYAAMNAAQKEIEPVARDTENTQTNSFYARLETVDAAIRPIYVKHGFSLSYNQVAPITPGNVRIACKCAHIGGHFEMHHREAPPDTLGPKGAPTKTALHGLGSADTYLRRYITCGIFNVVLRGMDNDGNRLRDTGELINQAQADELYALLAECSSDPAATVPNERQLLIRMGLGALGSIKNLPPARFSQVRTALLSKRARIRSAANGEKRS